MSTLKEIDKEILTLIQKRVSLLQNQNEDSNSLNEEQKKSIENKLVRDLKIQEEAITKNRSIGYLGPVGTFSNQIAIDVFSSIADLVPLNSIPDVFNEVSKGNIDNGIVPIENSINGSIVHTIDMLLQNTTNISAEATLNINHCFLSNSEPKNITHIYSHPQPFGQCWNWIKINYPNAELVEMSSTGSASKKASTEKNSGTIGSKILTDLYPIKLVEENIQDSTINQTRFLIIGKSIDHVDGPYKTSLSITLKDKPGSLFQLLQAFQKENISLTRIESRPSKLQTWCYNFLIDFEGNQKDPTISKILENLNTFAFSINVLGSYRKVI
ncbi:MAG: prephenate dehydratase [Planctomycetota bacterium]|nr:MAG: prephenate dehydratase [Planctomycetota bacterium]